MSDFEREHDDDDQDDIKELIERGREQGFLTYEEIHETLPEHVLEGDKYEEIVSLLVEMGIDVVEAPPEGEDNVVAVEEEELSGNVLLPESEIGRTTDPVRMYMREMGAVDLLTREGEIAIAKRIEAGLDMVQKTLANFPLAIAALLAEFAKIEGGEGKLADLVNGYGDPFAGKEEDLLVSDEEEDGSALADDMDDEELADDDSASPNTVVSVDTMNEAREKLVELSAVYRKLEAGLAKGQALSAKKNLALHEEVKEIMAAFSFPQQTIDLMEAQLEEPVEQIRQIERRLMRIVIDRAGMPRKSFVKEFPGSETDLDWVVAQSK